MKLSRSLLIAAAVFSFIAFLAYSVGYISYMLDLSQKAGAQTLEYISLLLHLLLLSLASGIVALISWRKPRPLTLLILGVALGSMALMLLITLLPRQRPSQGVALHLFFDYGGHVAAVFSGVLSALYMVVSCPRPYPITNPAEAKRQRNKKADWTKDSPLPAAIVCFIGAFLFILMNILEWLVFHLRFPDSGLLAHILLASLYILLGFLILRKSKRNAMAQLILSLFISVSSLYFILAMALNMLSSPLGLIPIQFLLNSAYWVVFLFGTYTGARIAFHSGRELKKYVLGIGR
ncbi:MAG: hypothetical protein Q8O09_02995 [Bacillota bacterium]|nr:hypothetical protein [Bacillota bacterium]